MKTASVFAKKQTAGKLYRGQSILSVLLLYHAPYPRASCSFQTLISVPTVCYQAVVRESETFLYFAKRNGFAVGILGNISCGTEFPPLVAAMAHA